MSMNSAVIILEQTIIMFILIFFGAGMFKCGIFTARGGKQLSDFVMRAVCPVLIFTSFQKDYNPQLSRGLLTAFLFSAIAFVIMIFLGAVTLRRKNRGENYAVEQFAVAYSNCGFLGIPLVEAVYGKDGVLFLTAFIALYNLFSWTHGVMLMTGKMNFRSLVNAVKAPAVIATLLGIICFFLRIRMPELVMQPLNYISSLNTPLAMVVSGIMIAQSDIAAALKKPGLYISCVLKLAVAPLLVIAALVPFCADTVVTNSVIIAAAAPSAASTIMFASRYGKNSVYAAEIFTLSTVLSIVTMPAMLLVAQLLQSRIAAL